MIALLTLALLLLLLTSHPCRDAGDSLHMEFCPLVASQVSCLLLIPFAVLPCRGATGGLSIWSSMLRSPHPLVLLPRHSLPALLPRAPHVSSGALLPDVDMQPQLGVHHTALMPPAAAMALVQAACPCPPL